MILKNTWSFLTFDRNMFLQSFSDQDILGQAFEDALEVLQQHSDREMQYSQGKGGTLLYFYLQLYILTEKNILIYMAGTVTSRGGLMDS